MLVSNRYGIDF